MKKCGSRFARGPAGKTMLVALAVAMLSAGPAAYPQSTHIKVAPKAAGTTKPVVQVRELLRFDPVTRQWRQLPVPTGSSSAMAGGASGRGVVRATSGAVVSVVPDKIGLYLLRWTENNTLYEREVFVGPVACNDLMMAPAPAGMIAACVPSSSQGMAMFIPVPPPLHHH